MVMDIWQVAMLGGVIAFIAYCVIYSIAERRRKERLIRKLFAYAHQIKDLLVRLAAIEDYRQEVREHLPSISPEELKRIELALVKKSMALAILSRLKMEKGFDFIGNHPFLNVALQKEDLAAIGSILEAGCGPEYQLYDIDLNDEKLSPLLAILKELAASRVSK